MNLHALLMRWVSLGDATTPGGCALLREQFRVLQKQMPILCAILCLSILSGIGGYGVPETAPWALRLAVPAVLLAITVVRMRYWLGLRTATLPPQKALG